MSEPMGGVETPMHYHRGRQAGQDQPGVVIREAPLRGYLNLRGDPDDPGFRNGIEAVTGLPLPCRPCTCARSGESALYWLGPDEWLVVTPPARQGKIRQKLEAALKGVFSSVVDNSSGLTTIHISGENAAALLATDCPLDLHPGVFRPGQCAQTRLARAGMTVAPLADDGSLFEVIIRRSFADYLLLWLQDAAIAFE